MDQVYALQLEDDAISGDVQAGAPVPFRVHVRFEPGNGVVLVDGEAAETEIPLNRCSCPLGGRCEHVVAVLLKGLAQHGDNGSRQPASASNWAQQLHSAVTATMPKTRRKDRLGTEAARLFYLLEQPDHDASSMVVRLVKARADPDGRIGPRSDAWSNLERALQQPPAFLNQQVDLPILSLLQSYRDGDPRYPVFRLTGADGHQALALMLKSGRLLARERPKFALHSAGPRAASFRWQLDPQGLFRFEPVATPTATHLIATDPPWYVDAERGEIGTAQFGLSSELLAKLLALPPLTQLEAEAIATQLSDQAPDLPKPAIAGSDRMEVIDVPLVPVLRLMSIAINGLIRYRQYESFFGKRAFDCALPRFRYGRIEVRPDDEREYYHDSRGALLQVLRDRKAETAAIATLTERSLLRVGAHSIYQTPDFPPFAMGLDGESQWGVFFADELPKLRELGWIIEVDDSFRHNVHLVQHWEATVDESRPGWFELDMGIVVDGNRMPLAPLLATLFKRDRRWLDARQLAAIDDDESIDMLADDGRTIRAPAGRIKPLAITLIELFGAVGSGPLRLSRFDAPRLDELANLKDWNLSGMQSVREMAEKLQASRTLTGAHAQAQPPDGLAHPLRPYQLEGVAWLQFLREHSLAGIVADDMGLGKTAQALAHVLLEKEAGRLDRPVLVVLPTSLVFNWKNEVARWTPGLTVLSLHGLNRHSVFAEIPRYDLVLTTYPLLWRVLEQLAKHKYHLLILDEAQTVKNAQTRAATAARKLNARHRLCLTGTPLENHLGELWSQFDFLLPGFLGDSRSFAKFWRTPIEKQGDAVRGERLRARIRPFILRRRKDEVAQELPPKTVIVRSVELVGAQRDLYETVRSAMDQRVRDAIARQGLARSSIVILDALLKLRQVCCDPRLLKTTSAQGVTERAKLELLMDMLPSLIEEGRRILVFSQFTEMLALIEIELQAAGIDYVQLTGQTRDREAVVKRFQTGDVPLFLISLKAGGVGLNLTAADVVIHYDPWWNPAVENQATDRAHRLGQDKAVFVYKLVVAGSIEERILALQERKALLADEVLADARSGEPKFDQQDLVALLEPLAEVQR